MTGALRIALARDRLSLDYQPILDIAANRVVACEALARWSNSPWGSVSPLQFIPLAEDAGLIGALERWSLRAACEQAARWQPVAEIDIRVNVSPIRLRDECLLTEVAVVLEDCGLPPRRLGLEITESLPMEDTDAVRDNLAGLGAMGVELLLDDFGTANSCFGTIRRFPLFDCLKIDRSLVQAPSDPPSNAVLSATVVMGHALGLTVVGEGVQSRFELDRLRQFGCDFAQGPYIAKPMSARDVDRHLRTLPDHP